LGRRAFRLSANAPTESIGERERIVVRRSGGQTIAKVQRVEEALSQILGSLAEAGQGRRASGAHAVGRQTVLVGLQGAFIGGDHSLRINVVRQVPEVAKVQECGERRRAQSQVQGRSPQRPRHGQYNMARPGQTPFSPSRQEATMPKLTDTQTIILSRAATRPAI